MVVRHFNPLLCLLPFHSHGSRITLFSTCLAIQIFGPKELATVTTLGVECFILVLFGVMSRFVMQLFSRDDDVEDDDTSATNNPPPAGQEHNV